MNNPFDLIKLMKEAGKIQETVAAQQDEMAKKHYEAEAGGGMVKATVNGLQEVISLKAEQDALDSLGLNSVLDLVAAAINEANKRAKEAAKGDMMSQFQNMAGGLFNNEEK